jgi:hypothetical protein
MTIYDQFTVYDRGTFVAILLAKFGGPYITIFRPLDGGPSISIIMVWD